MSKKRPQIRSVFIACEGKNTEPIYFERIKEEVEEELPISITIYPDRTDDTHKSDPIGLICEAQKNIGNYDEVWAVYDKDGYTKHKEAIELANKTIHGKKVNVAFSSISFEQWVLLHFERSKSAFPKSQDIIDSKFTKNEKYFKEYDKSATTDIYPQIRDKTLTAVENAAWLRNELANTLDSTPFFDVNPFTNMDELIHSLFELNERLHYVSLGNSILIDKCEFNFLKIEGDEIKIKLELGGDVSMVLNEIEFSSIDKGQESKINIQNQQILPNEPIIIDIPKVGILQIRFRGTRLVLDLN